MNDCAVYITPQKAVDGEPWFVAAVGMDPKEHNSGKVDVVEFLPPLWEGRFTEHVIPVSLLYGFELNLLTDQRRAALVCLESDLPCPGDPWLFFRSKIAHNSVLLWKNEDGSYGYFHCRQCAATALQFISANQEAWAKPVN